MQFPQISRHSILISPCSQTASICVPPLMLETKFRTIRNHRQNYSIVYSNFYVFRQQTIRQKVLD
jgi:hypothetical protein